MDQHVEHVASLLTRRNEIDAQIASIIGRPMTAGHLGEWLAHRVFGIALEQSAAAAGIDGRFTSGPLDGATVNIKWYLKRDGLLDVATASVPDYYLVLAGPAAPAATSRNTTRPWCVASIHLFRGPALAQELTDRGVKVGTATSLTAAQWQAAEIYPASVNNALVVDSPQRGLLERFAASRP